MGFFSEFVCLIGELHRSFRVPRSRNMISFFVMFRRGAVASCRGFVQFGDLPVSFVHGNPPYDGSF
jgi:hypothetical protein